MAHVAKRGKHMPIDLTQWMIIASAVLLAAGLFVWWITASKNLTIFRRYNRRLERLEKKYDINLSLKKVRFKHATPIALSHIHRNIGNLALVNHSISAFNVVYRDHHTKDHKAFIQSLSALSDLAPFYDTLHFKDESGWLVAGDIMRYFVNRRHWINDRMLIRIFGTKKYEKRGNRLYRAYSSFFVTVKIKKGLPEALVVEYPELEYVMKRIGKSNDEGHRVGWWKYRFIVNHDRLVLFYKRFVTRKLEDVRTLENINYIVENRSVYEECASIREAMLKMAKIQNLNEITLTEIDTMSGPQFQDWCQDALEAIYDVKTTKFLRDQKVDFMLEGNARVPKTVVLVFRQERPIGAINIEEVQKACFLHDADKGLIITNGEFTKDARDLAQGTVVTLISRNDLIDLIAKNNNTVNA